MTCAVVNVDADSVIQRTMYYASGVPMDESIGLDQQPYLYNGKEYITAHGLNEYDSHARMYYATNYIKKSYKKLIFKQKMIHIHLYKVDCFAQFSELQLNRQQPELIQAL